uniref:Uncharacterized protein n=1 Tax=Oryza meridionalis TaxID=40149 RepID=A0A0E0DNC3_9ORYZ
MEAAPAGAARAAEAGGSERATANNNEAADGGGLGGRRRQRRQRTTTPPPSYSYVLSLSALDSRLRAGGHDKALPRRPLYHLVSHLTGAAPHPFFSLLDAQEGAAARRQKSALDAGGDKWEAVATLAITTLALPWFFPQHGHKRISWRQKSALEVLVAKISVWGKAWGP